MVKVLLKHGAYVDSVGGDSTPLIIAAYYGDLEMIKVLLEADADPDIQDFAGDTALFQALDLKHWEIVQLLMPISDVELKNQRGHSTIHRIIENTDKEFRVKAMRLYIDGGFGDREICTDDLGDTPLFLAIRLGHEDVYDMLSDECVDFDDENHRKETVLHITASNSAKPGCPEMERLMADIAESMISGKIKLDSVNADNRTPLMEAVKSTNLPVARVLLQANCKSKMDRDTVTEDEVTKCMSSAVSRGFKESATFMFGDLCTSTDNQEYFYNLSLTAEASVDGKTIGLCKPPLSLYRLCRLSLRSLLPKWLHFPEAVDKLELPENVKDFLKL